MVFRTRGSDKLGRNACDALALRSDELIFKLNSRNNNESSQGWSEKYVHYASVKHRWDMKQLQDFISCAIRELSTTLVPVMGTTIKNR